ncbi:MAG: DUF3284 domain-containing protein [Clostridium sp.]
MSKFKVTKSFEYPIDEVFRGFLKITKREFPKFNENNPLGFKHKKVVKNNGNTKIELIMEVTKFEKESVYEITSKVYNDIYISRYTFNAIDDESSSVILEEEQYAKNFVSKIALIIQGITGGSKSQQKINRMATGITEEIEIIRRKIEKNSKK